MAFHISLLQSSSSTLKRTKKLKLFESKCKLFSCHGDSSAANKLTTSKFSLLCYRISSFFDAINMIQTQAQKRERESEHQKREIFSMMLMMKLVRQREKNDSEVKASTCAFFSVECGETPPTQTASGHGKWLFFLHLFFSLSLLQLLIPPSSG